MRVLIYATELHVSLAIERMLSRQGSNVRSVKQDEVLGAVFTEFDPTHVIAGSQSAFDDVAGLIEKRGSSAKLARFQQ